MPLPLNYHRQDHWLESPHGTMFIRTWSPEKAPGLEPPIVLFHDSLGCVELWRDFPDQLCIATGKTVIAYDRLGFGRSDIHPGGWTTQFIREEAERYFPLVKEHLGIDTFIAFGHSVGGGIAVHCAAHFPEQCRFLVSESAQAFVEERTLRGIRAAELAFQAPGQLDRLKRYHGEKAEWVLQAWTQTWQSPSMQNWDLERSIQSIRCPTLVIHGELDEYGSEQHARRIGNLAPGRSKVLLIENCGHVPHKERKDLVLETVAEFLQ